MLKNDAEVRFWVIQPLYPVFLFPSHRRVVFTLIKLPDYLEQGLIQWRSVFSMRSGPWVHNEAEVLIQQVNVLFCI